jgi:large subunit ribosomal protein L13
MQKSSVIKKDQVKQGWVLIDAANANLGKLAVELSALLIGKRKLTYTTNLFSGDNVIVINAKDIRVSAKKVTTKVYHRHSGYPGGLSTLSFEQLMRKNPSAVVRNAVKGMVPKTKIGDEMLSHLFVYNDEKNPHEAQKPTTLTFDN